MCKGQPSSSELRSAMGGGHAKSPLCGGHRLASAACAYTSGSLEVAGGLPPALATPCHWRRAGARRRIAPWGARPRTWSGGGGGQARGAAQRCITACHRSRTLVVHRRLAPTSRGAPGPLVIVDTASTPTQYLQRRSCQSPGWNVLAGVAMVLPSVCWQSPMYFCQACRPCICLDARRAAAAIRPGYWTLAARRDWALDIAKSRCISGPDFATSRPSYGHRRDAALMPLSGALQKPNPRPSC